MQNIVSLSSFSHLSNPKPMRLCILDRVSGSRDPQPCGAFLSAASNCSALVCGPHIRIYLQNVSVEADFGLFEKSWHLLCGMKDGRWLVCPENVGFAAALTQLLSQSLWTGGN